MKSRDPRLHHWVSFAIARGSAVSTGRKLRTWPTSRAFSSPYATEHESTGRIAERIAARLRERGARVDVRSVVDVDDVGGYDAVVLGSGVYNQSWIASATEFLRGNAVLLAARRVWPFSVGSLGDTHRGIGG
jgi:hypothetical protein